MSRFDGSAKTMDVRERLTRKERDRQDLKDVRIAIAEAKKKGTIRGSEVKRRLVY